jgi:hypothetical protein
MSDIIQTATLYIKSYVRDNYSPEEDRDPEEDLIMYNDKWIDNFKHTKHNFPVETSFEVVEMINYCNKYSEFHDFNQGHTTVEEITNLFLGTLLVEEKLI